MARDSANSFQGTSVIMSHVTISKSQISNTYQSSESVILAIEELEFSQKHNVNLGFIKLLRYGCYEKLLRTAATLRFFSS